MCKVVKLIICPKKGSCNESESLTLIEGVGIDGDIHADGGQMQISLLSASVLEWMNTQDKEICFKKFTPNILLDNIDLSALKTGDRLKIGKAEIEITKVRKKCHVNICNRQFGAEPCLLRDGVRYAKVTKRGIVIEGADVEIIHY